MTYNTQDGSTIKVRDLSGVPKIYGDYVQSPIRVARTEPDKTQRRDTAANKTPASSKNLRKSQI